MTGANRKLGQYTVRRRLAAGDYAEVYLCESEDNAVALKVFHLRSQQLARFIADTPGLSVARLRQRFRDEAALMAQFEHPHIVPVLNTGGLESDNPYYVMPYYPATLATKIRTRKRGPAGGVVRPLPSRAGVAVLRQILSGLSAMHARNIAHRDLNPGNILIDGDGVAAVADLSVARVPWPGYTPMRPKFGSFPFISPEQQADPHATDMRGDIYSLGAIAYVILTGQMPDAALPPQRIIKDIESGLSDWTVALLQADPDRRPRSAAEALLALNAAMPDPEPPY